MSKELAIIDVNIDRAEAAARLAIQITELERENRQLRRERDDALRDVERAREDADRALKALRRQLSPLYKALQAVFGELDAAGISDEPTGAPASAAAAAATDPRIVAVWASWKSKLGGTVAKGIDALLLHGELNTGQLAIACGLDRRTITNTVVFKLNQAGLITKNGGRFSLKAL